MNGKANVINFLTLILAAIGAYSTMFSESTQAWLGIAGMAISTVLATFVTNGTWVSGWSQTLWVTTIAGVVIQLLTAIGGAALIAPAVVTGVTTGINIFINVFYKSYGGAVSVAERTL